MATMKSVPRSTVGIGTIIPAETIEECKALIGSLSDTEAGVVELDENDDPAVYRKAFDTAATVLGVTLSVRKQRGNDRVMYVSKMTEEEATAAAARQKVAAAKRSKTAKAKAKAAADTEKASSK